MRASNALPTSHTPISLPLFRPWVTTILKFCQFIRVQGPLSVQVFKEKSHASCFKAKTKNYTAKWRRLAKSQDRPKARPNSFAVNTKEKFSEEIKNTIPGNMWMMGKVNSLIADLEKVLVGWTEKTSHNIPFSQSLIPSKALNLSDPVKTEQRGSCRRAGNQQRLIREV